MAKQTREVKENIIQAGYIAIDELVKVAKEEIIKEGEDAIEDLSADRLKNAAASKKLAIFDAFEILKKIKEEEDEIMGVQPEAKVAFLGFAEERSKK